MRSLRRAVPLALASALALVPASRASAQLLPCAPGSLNDYLAPGFRCELGGFRLGRFAYFDFVDPGSTLPVDLPNLNRVTLTPFEGVDAFGHTTFGFTVDRFVIRIDADDNVDPIANAFGEAFFGFSLRSLDPNVRLLGAGFDGRLHNESATPDDIFIASGVGGDVGRPTGTPIPGPRFCLDRHPDLIGLGTRTPSRDGDCRRPRRRARTLFGVGAELDRDDPTTSDPISGTARAALQEVRFVAQVVPEPATVALVGGGLLGLAGIAARRRRA